MAEQAISKAEAAKLSNDKLVGGKKKKPGKDKYHKKGEKAAKNDKRLKALNDQIKRK